MESSVAVGSNGIDNADPSSSAVANECIKVSAEKQPAVEEDDRKNQCSSKSASVEEERVDVSELHGKEDAINSFPTKDAHEVKVNNSEKATIEDLGKKCDLPTAGKEVVKNETEITLQKKEETSTVEDTVEKKCCIYY